MTVQEAIRIRERVRDELGGADTGAPATTLINHPAGFVLKLRHAGKQLIIANEGDLDRHLKGLQP